MEFLLVVLVLVLGDRRAQGRAREDDSCYGWKGQLSLLRDRNLPFLYTLLTGGLLPG